MKKAAKILKNRNNEILESWAKAVKKEVKAARKTTPLALRDSLPSLLEDISSILDNYLYDQIKEKKDFEEIVENSEEHGRHRASTSGYTVEEILREYIIFHRTITNVLMHHNAYNSKVGVVLKYTLENAMLNSVKTFSDSMQELRQKMMGVLAHDLRNPITAANLAVSMMNYEDGPERFEKIRKITLSSLERAVELVEGLLDSVKIEAGEGMTLVFEEADIMRTIRSIYEEATAIYSNDFHLKHTDEKISGVFDTTMVRRVIENFVSNAVKYGDRKTPVSIRVSQNNEWVSIEVHNEGTPIPADNQSLIFDFLNTSEKEKSGEIKSWGIGLTLVKAVAEAHGGRVALESTRDKGTVFSLVLNKFANKPGRVKSALKISYNP